MGHRCRLVRRSVVVVAAALIGTACGGDAASETTAVPGTDDSPPPTPIEQPEETDTMTEPTSSPAPDTSPSTPGPAPSVEPAATVATTCRRVADFDADSTADWVVVNDGVMGGRSNGAVEFADSTMRFTGTVVTAGGGFTSVRLGLDGTELADTERVELRMRTDERAYGLTFEDAAEVGGRSVSHRADLATGGTVDADGWAIVALRYDELRPSVFGQPVDAPPFDPGAAREIGIIIADGIDGDFALEVDWIDACR